MWIDNFKVARIIDAKPINIRKTKKIDDQIEIQLWHSKEKKIISISEYENFNRTICKKEVPNNPQNKISIQTRLGYALMPLGCVCMILGLTMDTTVSNGYGNVHNIGLISHRQSLILIGGFTFTGGAILQGLSKKS